jgi:predicted DNA-binding protein with PD1-like motif
MPAASRDGVHVAWYSDVIAPEGPVDLVECVASVGERDGKPFIHCHGRWRTADGMRMGHMLAPNCRVVAPIAVTGIGFARATFRGMPDSETLFTLFEPVAVDETRESGVPALLVRVRPNVDICVAIESVCREHGIAGADVFGIGSLNEVHFADRTWMRSHATELLVRRGRVATIETELRASLDIAVVDIGGNIAAGEILRGDNPVCVTFELAIVPDATSQ